MSRIRSVHPGLFTDEAFVSLSMPARMLLIGIWTEADDHGIFEWKPITLKMKVFPADSVDVSALLKELVAADHVKTASVSGKNYGIVRNFRKYQRPKSPSYVHPFLPEWGNYIGLKGAEGEMKAVDVDALPPIWEKSPQMEDEGGEEEVGEIDRPVPTAAVAAAEDGFFSAEQSPLMAKAVSIAIAPRIFEDFWDAYPKRDGANPREPAKKKFIAAIKSGENPDALIASAKKYASELRATNKFGTQFVARAVTWLSERRWCDYGSRSSPDDEERVSREMLDRGYVWREDRWQKLDAQNGVAA